MSVRTATAKDVNWMLDVLEHLWEESPIYKHYTKDRNYVWGALHAMLCRQDMIMLVDDAYKAFMIGCVSNQWYAPDIEAFEMLLAVDKQFRGGMTAVRLIKEFERECRERNATAIYVGSSLGIADETAKALYRKLGFSDYGAGLHKRL